MSGGRAVVRAKHLTAACHPSPSAGVHQGEACWQWRCARIARQREVETSGERRPARAPACPPARARTPPQDRTQPPTASLPASHAPPLTRAPPPPTPSNRLAPALAPANTDTRWVSAQSPLPWTLATISRATPSSVSAGVSAGMPAGAAASRRQRPRMRTRLNRHPAPPQAHAAPSWPQPPSGHHPRVLLPRSNPPSITRRRSEPQPHQPPSAGPSLRPLPPPPSAPPSTRPPPRPTPPATLR